MGYRLLAEAVAGLHYAFMAYLVFGGVLAWRWPRTAVLHLLAVGWGVTIVAFHLLCPLTVAQNALRVRGGEPKLAASFIDTYLRGTFYPAGSDVAARLVVATIVAVSWSVLAVRVRSRRAARVSGGTG